MEMEQANKNLTLDEAAEVAQQDIDGNEGMLPNNDYMVMQNPGQNVPQFAQGPLGALRQIKDSKKNEW